jgi:aminopeptidase N
MYALSNGGLLETTQDVIAKTKTYHWKMSIPHSTYLVMLAVADFVEIMDSWDGIPVPYYVLPGGEEKARISLGKTPQMMQFFSEKIGLRYPYEKYATVCVSSFIFGGMENTTATTLTEYTLHDERAHQDFSSDPLVAHELVHQWFGDWLTCRDWSHGWLNEGFATYFEALWAEYDLGRDEFIYELYQNAVNYFGEDSGNYRRPIVTNVFHSPIDLFDRHLYEKGSLVLHMVRYILGEELWWKAINYYTNKHKGQSVITADLERAIEEATGVNMQGFFEQWVYKAGYPQFKLDWSYDDKTTTARFKVAQTQEVNHETSLFTLPVEIAFVSESGKREVFKVELEEKEQTFYFKLSEKPLFAGFDPSNWILKTVEWKRPKEQLIAQLEKDPEVFMRVVAAQELGKQGGLEAIAALQKALAGDGFWGVKVEAAKGLGVIKTRAAEEALLKALESEQNAKVRRAIVSALGEFRTEPAATALVKVLSGDKTDIVEGVAATALGKTRQPVAFEALKAALERDSFNQVVRNGTLNGLVELKEDVKVLPLVMEWTAYGKPEQVRQTAATFLGTIGKRLKEAEKEPVVDRIIELLQDPNWRVRLASIRAAQTLGDARAIPRLQSIVETALEGREVRLSREAIKAIREGSERDEEVKKLREDLDKLQGENRELKERLESLEQKLK